MEKRSSEDKEILISEMEAKIQELQKELENHLLTEKKLKESEEKFRIISEQSLMGVVIYQDNLVKYINKAAVDIYGGSVEEFTSWTRFEQFELYIHPDDVDFLRDQAQKKQFGENGAITNYKFRVIPQPGKLKWVEIFSKTITYEGKPADLVTLIDISERIRAEEKLRKSEGVYRNLFETMTQGVVYQSAEGEIISANPASVNILGLTVEQMRGSTTTDPGWKAINEDGTYFTRDTQPSMVAIQTGKEVRNVIMGIFNPKIEQNRWININAVPQFRAGENKPYQVYITLEDITERKQAGEFLRESEEKFRIISEQSLLGILIHKHSNIKYVNQAAADIYGSSIEYMMNLREDELYDKFTHPDDRNFVKEQGRKKSRGLKGQITSYSSRVITKDGKMKWTKLYSKTITFQGELAVLVTMIDITEQKKIEDEYLKNQKIESIGVLAGGIAHDFNNILTSVLGNISLMKLDMDPSSQLFDNVIETEKAILRAGDLTDQLLTFSKGGEPIKKLCSLKEIIKDSADFVLRSSNILGIFYISDDLWTANVDRGQISQVVQNLVINAIQASNGDSSIIIRAENQVIDEQNSMMLNPGYYVKFCVKDFGIGIQEENLQKIFDPYFTTKSNGNGLGLSICHSIVRKHRGTITVSSKIDVGSIFNVYIPADSSKIILESRNKPELVKEDKINEKVLVLEDEEVVIHVLGSILKRLKYEFKIVETGEKAIFEYKQALEAGSRYHVVILDLTIPGGMGGEETMKKLLIIDPEVKAIVSSGYGTGTIMSNFEQFGFQAVLEKPYTIAELSTSLRKILDKK